MKQLLRIALIFIGLFLIASCSKEDVRPIKEDQTIPVWEKGTDKDSFTTPIVDDNEGDNEDVSVDDDIDIVDPNFDPDGKGKR